MLSFIEKGHLYELDGKHLPSVSEVLRFLSREVYGEIAPAILDHAAERGTAVHSATEQIDKNGECEISPLYAGYINAYIRFLSEHKTNWRYIETPFADPQRGFAGTPDRIGLLDGESCILDIKTCSAVKKTLVKAQLNGYLSLCNANGITGITALSCLQLCQDGRYRLYQVKIDSTEFDACLSLHQAMKIKHGRMKIL